MRTVASSSLAVTLAVLPVGLVGALAVMIRQDFGFGHGRLGLAITVYFIAAGAASPLGGRLADAIGASPAILTWSTVSSLSLLFIAFISTSWPELVALLAVSGVANGAVQPAANRAISERAVKHEAFAFGVKQGSVPFAYMIAGLVAALIGSRFTWRIAISFGASLLIVIVLLESFGSNAPLMEYKAPRVLTVEHGPDLLGLGVLALAMGLGAWSAVAANAFLVEAGSARDLGTGFGGVTLASSSASAIAIRLAAGAIVDRRPSKRVGSYFLFSSLMLFGGALGFLILAFSEGRILFALGAAVAFSLGWGWTGLLVFAIVKANRDAPARATGVVQVGLFVGGVLGPMVFGFMAEHFGFRAAWLLNSLVAGLGAVAVILARGFLTEIKESKGSGVYT